VKVGVQRTRLNSCRWFEKVISAAGLEHVLGH
jgi:hypothetical protein